jgi:soluble lytic murein transglycosylase-like protein
MVCNHHEATWEYIEIDYFEQHKQMVLEKIIQIESEGNPMAVGDNGKAIGLLQIWPIMIHEVNRLLKEERYSLEDRWDSLKSIEMFITYQQIVNPDWNEELAARRWNGGIRGERNPKTDIYWEKYLNQ